jgi:hypothetical protein
LARWRCGAYTVIGNSRLDLRVPFAMQSRAAEYRMHAVVCAAQAIAAPDPMKQFYQALELQWVCLAQRAEREAVTSQQDEIAAASRTSKAA